MSKISRFRRQTNGFIKGNHFNLGIFDFKGGVQDPNRGPLPSIATNIAQKVVDTGRGMTLTQVMSTFCSSMSLPSTQSPATMVNIHEGSPKIAIAGTKVYVPWQVEFFGDEALLLRSMFVKWHQLVTNDQNHSYGLPSQYKSQSAFACVLSPSDIPVHCYSFKGLWPSEIGGISLDTQAGDIIKFSVTFSYDYFTINDIEGFGLAMAYEANEAFQNAGGLFGDGIRAGSSRFFDQIINAPLSTSIKVPF